MYEKGLGVDQDLFQAMAWYMISGPKSARQSHALRGKMSTRQISKAKKWVAAWRKKQK
jgi:TPR repeat protein